MRLLASPTQVDTHYPPLVSVVVFDPWPFHDSSVDLDEGVSYIDRIGNISGSEDGPYNLNSFDNAIATDAVGRQFVTSQDGVAAYCFQHNYLNLITVKDTHS